MAIRHEAETFHLGEREAQRRWGTPDLWDADRKERLLWNEIPEGLHEPLEAAPFFFLATCSEDGHCDCSFKGGGPGLIRILDSGRFAFPDFHGNGAFMSLGNILSNPQVGCLFIDFADGARLRVNGRATVHDSGDLLDLFPGAARVTVVDVDLVVPNCTAHVPRLVPAPQGDSVSPTEKGPHS